MNGVATVETLVIGEMYVSGTRSISDLCRPSAELRREPPNHLNTRHLDVMQSPFFNLDAEPLVRDWPQIDKLSVPDDVGRKARLKSKAANQAENDLDH
jgi:hypothetical protein